MLGHFSPEALRTFAEAHNLDTGNQDFSEGVFDFKVCQKPDGKYFGIKDSAKCTPPNKEAKQRPDTGFFNTQAGRGINYDTAKQQGDVKTYWEKIGFKPPSPPTAADKEAERRRAVQRDKELEALARAEDRAADPNESVLYRGRYMPRKMKWAIEDTDARLGKRMSQDDVNKMADNSYRPGQNQPTAAVNQAAPKPKYSDADSYTKGRDLYRISRNAGNSHLMAKNKVRTALEAVGMNPDALAPEDWQQLRQMYGD